MPKKVLLVDDDEMLRKMTNALLVKQGFEVIAMEDGPKTLEHLKTARPDIILLDVMMPGMDGFTVCREIRANPATSRIPIIMLTALNSVENKVKGFEAGADDYLSKPFDTAELVARINVMIRRAEANTPQVTVPVIKIAREAARSIAVFSLRGGSGVTTIAVNLAAGLSQLWGMQVALVDMVPVAGQTALFLNQSLRNTWADLCLMEVIDEEAVLSAMLPHESRIRTLASPRRPEESDMLTPEKVKTILEVLRSTFPYVVLDMPHDFSERSLAALDQSDVILIITQPEIVSLRATSMALEIFEALKYNEQKNIYVILNWTFPRQGLAFKDIERMLKSKIDLILPYAADEFVTAMNVGNPPVLSNPEGQLGVIFEDIAMSLSKDSQRKVRPEQPTLTWKRVAERIRKKPE
ncbi:MAG TPA: response regulator [Anaerolineaceae bacterium]